MPSFWQNDIRLVTTNAKTFNPPGTIYYTEAERIETFAIDHINKAAASVIEYEGDWNIDVERDDDTPEKEAERREECGSDHPPLVDVPPNETPDAEVPGPTSPVLRVILIPLAPPVRVWRYDLPAEDW